MARIRIASYEDLDQLSLLFDSYRVFYQQETDLPGAREFLTERMRNNQSVVFMAF